MIGPDFNTKTHVSNDAVETDTAVETPKMIGESVFGSEGAGPGSGESILNEMGSDYNRRTDEGEEYEDEYEDDGEGYEEEEGGGGGREENGGQEERPKLDEGYFEIEAIRRKRSRKGKIQYLIKWRGWPETANTWEPVENLQSIADVIDAFEASMRPGKPGRKPKRKYVGPQSHMKNKKQRLSTSLDAAATTEKSDYSTSLNNSSIPDSNQVDLSGSSLLKQYREANNAFVANQFEANSSRTVVVEKEKEYDPTLNELRGPADGSEGDNVRANGFLKVYSKEVDRQVGAKKRKSGSVKRFKQDDSTSNNQKTARDENMTQDLTSLDSFGRIARIGNNEYPVNDDMSRKSKMEELDIVKIVKPISFSASVSSNVQDVLVTFAAMRSDGVEVMVDNRFLKAHNPLLLIEFYEQHLKYNTTS